MNGHISEAAALTGALSLRTILVAVDLSPHSEATARYAVGIAKPFGASIVLVHVQAPIEVNEFVTEGGYEALDQQRRDTQRTLLRLTETLREVYPACTAAFLIGNPAEQVAGLAHDRNADLIITASHHPGFLARLLHLDQAPQIMHRAPCPVLVYHEGNQTVVTSPISSPALKPAGLEWDEWAATRKKILAPVDLTAEPGPALGFAVKLVQQWEADLYLLHVYSAPPFVTSPRYIYAVQGMDWHRRQFEAKLRDWACQLQKQHPRTFPIFEDGEFPAKGIKKVAGELHADLIVVSTHDRAWLSKWFLYSDADDVARKATSPVLVFRAKQEDATSTPRR